MGQAGVHIGYPFSSCMVAPMSCLLARCSATLGENDSKKNTGRKRGKVVPDVFYSHCTTSCVMVVLSFNPASEVITFLLFVIYSKIKIGGGHTTRSVETTCVRQHGGMGIMRLHKK